MIKDAFSGFKPAYPMPDKTADSTADAIKHIKGDRVIERLYSDRSGEIDKALRNLHIVAEYSQPGVPQHNAVAEQLVSDVLEGTRTVLVRAALPPPPPMLFGNMRADIIAFRTTLAGFPKWQTVRRRITTDLTTGDVIEDLVIDSTKDQDLHVVNPDGPNDIKTTLYYYDRASPWEMTHGSSCTGHLVPSEQRSSSSRQRPSKRAPLRWSHQRLRVSLLVMSCFLDASGLASTWLGRSRILRTSTCRPRAHSYPGNEKTS